MSLNQAEIEKKQAEEKKDNASEQSTTYLERVSNSFYSISPHLMLYTKAKMYEDLRQLEQLEHENSAEAEEKKKAINHRLNSALHDSFRIHCKQNNIPMENALIPVPFRFCAFVPNNALIAYILLAVPNLPFFQLSSPVRFAFYNAYNRAYCVGLDYCNRSGFTTADDFKILEQPFWKRFKSYVPALTTACVTACTVGYFLERALCSLHLEQAKYPILRSPVVRRALAPTLALSLGHAIDLSLARYKEIKYGIPLYTKHPKSGEMQLLNIRKTGSKHDEEPELVNSRTAGALAVGSTLAQRVGTASFVLVSNAVTMSLLDKSKFVSKYPKVKLPLQLVSCAMSCWAAIPLTMGYAGDPFPKLQYVPSELKNKRDQMGNEITSVYYARGK